MSDKTSDCGQNNPTRRPIKKKAEQSVNNLGSIPQGSLRRPGRLLIRHHKKVRAKEVLELCGDEGD